MAYASRLTLATDCDKLELGRNLRGEVVIALETDGHRVGWCGTPEAARSIARAIIDQADEVDAITGRAAAKVQ